MPSSPRRTVRSLWRTALLVAVSVALLSPTSARSSAGGDSVRRAVQGVCAGVAGCHVKARADVNGDGSRDVIGIARRGKIGAPVGAVLVRVKVGPHRIEAFRARTSFWYGKQVWQGVADLDRRSGKEIVVGRTQGAHAQFYRSLTWFDGNLVPLQAPGKRKSWYIDGAVWISWGWQRLPTDPVGTMRRRAAVRVGDAVTSRFKGKITTFRWADGRWKELDTKTIFPLPDKRAFRWGGFHVPGLDQW
jgi:hypothetical protein